MNKLSIEKEIDVARASVNQQIKDISAKKSLQAHLEIEAKAKGSHTMVMNEIRDIKKAKESKTIVLQDLQNHVRNLKKADSFDLHNLENHFDSQLLSNKEKMQKELLNK